MGCFAFPGQTAAPVGQNYTAACSAGVYTDSKYVEEALTYVNWLASQEGGEAYANGVLGFFSPNPAASELKDERAKEWQALSNGKTMIHMLGYETMYDGSPDYSTAIGNTVRAMVADGLTAEAGRPICRSRWLVFRLIRKEISASCSGALPPLQRNCNNNSG